MSCTCIRWVSDSRMREHQKRAGVHQMCELGISGTSGSWWRLNIHWGFPSRTFTMLLFFAIGAVSDVHRSRKQSTPLYAPFPACHVCSVSRLSTWAKNISRGKLRTTRWYAGQWVGGSCCLKGVPSQQWRGGGVCSHNGLKNVRDA